MQIYLVGTFLLLFFYLWNLKHLRIILSQGQPWHIHCHARTNLSQLFMLSPLWIMCTVDSSCIEFNCHFMLASKRLHSASALKWNVVFLPISAQKQNKQGINAKQIWEEWCTLIHTVSHLPAGERGLVHIVAANVKRERRSAEVLWRTRLPTGIVLLSPKLVTRPRHICKGQGSRPFPLIARVVEDWDFFTRNLPRTTYHRHNQMQKQKIWQFPLINERNLQSSQSWSD